MSEQYSYCSTQKKKSNIAVSTINMDVYGVYECVYVQWMLMQQHYSVEWIIIRSKCAKLIERKGTWYSKQIKCVQQHLTEIGVNAEMPLLHSIEAYYIHINHQFQCNFVGTYVWWNCEFMAKSKKFLVHGMQTHICMPSQYIVLIFISFWDLRMVIWWDHFEMFYFFHSLNLRLFVEYASTSAVTAL